MKGLGWNIRYWIGKKIILLIDLSSKGRIFYFSFGIFIQFFIRIFKINCFECNLHLQQRSCRQTVRNTSFCSRNTYTALVTALTDYFLPLTNKKMCVIIFPRCRPAQIRIRERILRQILSVFTWLPISDVELLSGNW